MIWFVYARLTVTSCDSLYFYLSIALQYLKRFSEGRLFKTNPVPFQDSNIQTFPLKCLNMQAPKSSAHFFDAPNFPNKERCSL
jgi:hypothetical protein